MSRRRAEYRRRCPECRRPMTAQRGALVAKGVAYESAVLTWNCPACRIEIPNHEAEE